MNVAATILAQLGGNRFVVMTGAKHLASTGNSLQFKLPRFPGIKINFVKITLNSMDTYDIEFGRIQGLKYTVLSKVDGIYADMLRSVFTSRTGLETSL